MGIVIHNIIVYYRKIVNYFCRVINKTVYFENKYGVKAYNKIKFCISETNKYPLVELNPAEVYLGFDALKDEYTHLETKIPQSPHADMIRRIYNNENIKDSQYVKDELLGSLDGRYEMLDRKSLMVKHKEYTLSNNKGDLPLVYYVGTRYYVLDGKHRLSSALINQERLVTCVNVPLLTIANHAYTQGILFKMKRTPDKYSKNIRHIEEMVCLARIKK